MSNIDVKTHRRARLKLLLDQRFAGKKVALGLALGHKSGAFVRQMLDGERPVSEKTVSAIHDLPGLAGWMDQGAGAAPAVGAAQEAAQLKLTAAVLIRQLIEVSQHLPNIEREVLAQYAARQILNGPDPDALHMLNRIVHGDASADLLSGVEPEPSWRDEAVRLAELSPEVERPQLVAFVQRVDVWMTQQKDKKAAAHDKKRTKAAASTA